MVTAGTWHQPQYHSGSRKPSGQSTPPTKVSSQSCARGCTQKEMGPEAAAAQARAERPGSWRTQQVLVDNKSTAEIGKKCLSLGGPAAFRR